MYHGIRDITKIGNFALQVLDIQPEGRRPKTFQLNPPHKLQLLAEQ
jgi:hypothetical protein